MWRQSSIFYIYVLILYKVLKHWCGLRTNHKYNKTMTSKWNTKNKRGNNTKFEKSSLICFLGFWWVEINPFHLPPMDKATKDTQMTNNNDTFSQTVFAKRRKQKNTKCFSLTDKSLHCNVSASVSPLPFVFCWYTTFVFALWRQLSGWKRPKTKT